MTMVAALRGDSRPREWRSRANCSDETRLVTSSSRVSGGCRTPIDATSSASPRSHHSTGSSRNRWGSQPISANESRSAASPDAYKRGAARSARPRAPSTLASREAAAPREADRGSREERRDESSTRWPASRAVEWRVAGGPAVEWEEERAVCGSRGGERATRTVRESRGGEEPRSEREG